jgi:beta-glucanase (GH16 family)
MVMKILFQIPLFILLLIFLYGQHINDARLIWADEFEIAGAPDSSKWSYNIGDHGWGNNEQQFYTSELKNVRIENGKLIIEAHADSNKPKGYTSARLVTKGKAAWTYGYFEIMARLPSGTGTWPAIWMLSETNPYGGWPKSGEIDIMEHVGFDPSQVHGTVHTEAFNHSIGTEVGEVYSVSNFNSAFHTYAVDWSSEKIDFYIDDSLYFTFEKSGDSSKEWPFDHPFHLILNLAVGGNWGGQKGVDPSIWPQKMEIEYIRIFDKKPF